MPKNDGGPAFPTPSYVEESANFIPGTGYRGFGIFSTPGMTLRQWYAGMAMQGMLANPTLSGDFLLDELAQDALDMANAMLKEGADDEAE